MEPSAPSPQAPTRAAPLPVWVAFFEHLELPVLRHTARDMLALAADIDRVDARSIADTVLQDPLMTLKVFAWSARMRRSRQVTDLETIEPVILMSGITAFFREFAELPTVEQQLAGQPRALAGLLRVVNRAFRSSHFARDWALRRRDLDTEVILIGAMLHDFAELLMWLYAPSLALEVDTRQAADATLRSHDVQQAVFGVALGDLEAELVRRWHLPELLVSVMDDRHADHARVRNVKYAVNLARHSAKRWDNAALGDDFRDIASLLNISPAHVVELVVPPEHQHLHLPPALPPEALLASGEEAPDDARGASGLDVFQAVPPLSARLAQAVSSLAASPLGLPPLSAPVPTSQTGDVTGILRFDLSAPLPRH